MKIFKAKSKRTKIFALITFAMIAVLFGLNLLLSLVGLNKSVYIDMTPEGLYSVTDEMKKECAFIDDLSGEDKLRIIFCNDPDNLKDNTLSRVTYFMALKLEKMFDNIEVEEINVNFNPTAVSKYKATSLSKIKTSDIIVAYGTRYRIASAESFWALGEEGQYAAYNGEYKLATLIKSVTLANDGNPTAYFVTGHGETVYNPEAPEDEKNEKSEQLKNLLLDRGFKIKTINLSDPEADEIPTDCALLIINNPTSDFLADESRFDEFSYVSETEKLDRYLTKNQGALMVAKDPGVSLPILEDFLSEWGFSLSDSTVKVSKDESNSALDPDNMTDVIRAEYIADTESYAYAIYGDFSSVSSSPKTVFSGAGYIECSYGENESVTEPGSFDISKVYSSFLKSPSGAVPYSASGAVAGTQKSYDVAAVTTRVVFDSITTERTFSYVFCANDGDFFSNELLGNAAYANFEIMSALINSMTGVDIYASSDLGGDSLNLERYGGKQLFSTSLSAQSVQEIIQAESYFHRGVTTSTVVLITVFVALVPIAVFVTGFVIFIKRKYL